MFFNAPAVLLFMRICLKLNKNVVIAGSKYVFVELKLFLWQNFGNYWKLGNSGGDNKGFELLLLFLCYKTVLFRRNSYNENITKNSFYCYFLSKTKLMFGIKNLRVEN